MITELISQFVQRGLPVIGSVIGATVALKKNKGVAKTTGYAAGGFGAGYLTQRMIFWAIDRIQPGLPDENASLNTDDVPEIPQEKSASIGATPNATNTGGDGAKKVTPIHAKTKNPFSSKKPMGMRS